MISLGTANFLVKAGCTEWCRENTTWWEPSFIAAWRHHCSWKEVCYLQFGNTHLGLVLSPWDKWTGWGWSCHLAPGNNPCKFHLRDCHFSKPLQLHSPAFLFASLHQFTLSGIHWKAPSDWTWWAISPAALFLQVPSVLGSLSSCLSSDKALWRKLLFWHCKFLGAKL